MRGIYIMRIVSGIMEALKVSYLQIFMEVKLGKERSRTGNWSSHKMRESQPHPGWQWSRVWSSECEPGGQVVLIIHAADEVTSILQPLSRAEILHVACGHVRCGSAVTIVSEYLILTYVRARSSCTCVPGQTWQLRASAPTHTRHHTGASLD